jgi:hypothetical protein
MASPPKLNTQRGVEEQQPPAAEQRHVEWKPLSALLLDPLNPRLPDDMEDASQRELLTVLAEDYSLQEIGRSLADNGYFAEEPLVVVPGKKRDNWTVVEGNRRLAALKLLDDPGAAPKSLVKTWTDLAAGRKVRVTHAPVLVYTRREDVTPYLGFRHITGVLEWAPYQKARYIAQLIERQNRTFAQIAREIGSTAPNVREHYVAFTLVRQAKEKFSIETAGAEQSFGILRRALSDPDIRDFAGVTLDRSEAELRNPIPRAKAESARELLAWMFGTQKAAPVLKDSRELRKLGKVLANSATVDVLRSTRNLDYAFELSGGEEQRLIEFLTKASYFLDQALPMVVRHRNSDKVAQAIERCRETLLAVEKLLRK